MNIKMLKALIPKKFLCRYPLSTGAIVGSITLMCVTIICIVALIVQVLLMKNCANCTAYVWRNAYSFSITGVIYCFIMFAMHGWLMWGIKEKKSSILLSWVVITSMWLSQTFFLLITLICMHSSEINFVAWILCLVLGLIAIGVLTYFVLIVFGLWQEVKHLREKSVNITMSTDK
ncbi:uncharacterized protein LOC113398441 [Vanessa tameamea]|uniref:Uncharacterized protein LOC113398441 n=1 Tax=Vanessa tameamea TaxID=334116 RepID=A0A8B8I7C6_VANTA